MVALNILFIHLTWKTKSFGIKNLDLTKKTILIDFVVRMGEFYFYQKLQIDIAPITDI